MQIKGKETPLILLMTALWIAITLCGWWGQWFLGLILGCLLMLVHMMMGSAQNGILHKKLFLYPLLSWFVLWVAGFIMTEVYANQFAGVAPSFTILGFHPSFAFIILFYWIGGVLTLTLGLVRYAHHWLSTDQWDHFKQRIAEIERQEEAV